MLDELERLLAAETAHGTLSNHGQIIVVGEYLYVQIESDDDYPDDVEIARVRNPQYRALIASARNALPALLRLARAVTNEHAAMRRVNAADSEADLHAALTAHSAAHADVVAALAALEAQG